MSALDLNKLARMRPIAPPNRVASVMKLADGGLRVTLRSGQRFDLGPHDERVQAFIIYSVIMPEVTGDEGLPEPLEEPKQCETCNALTVDHYRTEDHYICGSCLAVHHRWELDGEEA